MAARGGTGKNGWWNQWRHAAAPIKMGGGILAQRRRRAAAPEMLQKASGGISHRLGFYKSK